MGKNNDKPVKRDAAFYVTRGLVWVGCVGGFTSAVLLTVLQKMLDPAAPLNDKYKEAPVWVPGLFLIAGPLLGLGYYALFRPKADEEERMVNGD